MPISDIFVFFGGIEAWAILSRKIPVTMYLGIRIELAHSLEEPLQIKLLRIGSGVLSLFVVGSHAAYIANADTLGVVSGAMRTRYIHVAPLFHFSVGMNNIMITYIRKTPLKMPLANGVERVVLTFRSSRTMHDYLIDRARALLQFALLGSLQRRPRLLAHYSVGHKSVSLLKLLNRFLC